MGYEWIAAAAAATAAGIGNIAMMSKKRGTTRLMKVSKELAKYNNDLNVHNWQLQNEYDSPAAQMQRYKEAGLNPNLIYGNMSSGTAPAAGQVSTNPEDYTSGSDRYANMLQGIAGAIGTYQDIKAKQGQIDQTRAVTDQLQTQKILNLQSAEKQSLENEYARASMGYKLEGLAYDNARKLRQNSVGEIYDTQHAINQLEMERKKILDMDLDSDVKKARIRQIDYSIDIAKGNLELARDRNRIAELGLGIQFGQLDLANREFAHRSDIDLEEMKLRQRSADIDLEEMKLRQRSADRSDSELDLRRKQAIIDTYNKLDDVGNGAFGIPKIIHDMFNTKKRRTRNIDAVRDYYVK